LSTVHPAIDLEAMTEQLRQELYAYIRSKIGDPSAADDLTQETFLRVERALARGTEPEHFRGWIFQIARNSVVDWRNDQRRFVALEDEGVAGENAESGADDSIDSEFRRGLFSYATKVIEGMPAEDREALTLTELDGLSREELASHLGISVSGAKSRVVRARAKLKKAIEDCCRLITDPYGKVIGWKRRAVNCCAPSPLKNMR
jgi:RNA polymerase sigma-70 factor (ECF subfamily)